MKVSFAITTHNEDDCLEDLLTQLRIFIEDSGSGQEFGTEDEIVILDDYSTNSDTIRILESHYMEPYISLHRRRLNRDFGAQKSYLNTLCMGDYIFQIDADEMLAPFLLDHLHEVLEEQDPYVDLLLVPRVNTVENITFEHIEQWGWKVNGKGWIMWPDYQTRIYRNDPEIMWVGKVHERVQGHRSYGMLPEEESFAILHISILLNRKFKMLFTNRLHRSLEVLFT